MAEQREIYNHHEILCSCTSESRQFTATATIMWTSTRGTAISLFLRSPQTGATAEAALAAALQLARTWMILFPRSRIARYDIHSPSLSIGGRIESRGSCRKISPTS